jgi:hypothetical protein
VQKPNSGRSSKGLLKKSHKRPRLSSSLRSFAASFLWRNGTARALLNAFDIHHQNACASYQNSGPDRRNLPAAACTGFNKPPLVTAALNGMD